MPSDIEMPSVVEATWLTLKMELPDVTYDELEEKWLMDLIRQSQLKLQQLSRPAAPTPPSRALTPSPRAIIVCYNIH